MMMYFQPSRIAFGIMVAYAVGVLVYFSYPVFTRNYPLELLYVVSIIFPVLIVVGPVLILSMAATRSKNLGRTVFLIVLELAAIGTMAVLLQTTAQNPDAQDGIAIMMIAVAQYLVVGSFFAIFWVWDRF